MFATPRNAVSNMKEGHDYLHGAAGSNKFPQISEQVFKNLNAPINPTLSSHNLGFGGTLGIGASEMSEGYLLNPMSIKKVTVPPTKRPAPGGKQPFMNLNI